MTSEGLRNWAGNHAYGATTVHRPTTVEQVQGLVARSTRLRAVGSRHSFNDLVDADELVCLDALPATVEVDSEARTVRVAAAVRYGALATQLHRQGWALPNMASLPHISVAGAVATATHGSGDRSGNLSSAVAGLELVTADGSTLALTRADADLAGAVVGLGALGVVTAVTLEVEATYDVVQRVHTGLPWSVVEDDLDAVFGSADSVSLFTDWRGPTVAQVWRKSRVGDGRRWWGGTPSTTQRHPLPDGDPASTTAQLGEPGPWHERLPHFTAGHVPSAGAEVQSEWFVGRRDAVAALRAVRGLAELLAPVLLVSEVRTVAADRLWLSTAYGRDTVGLHFTWAPRQDEVEVLLPVVEAALAPFAPRPHWGKLFHALDPAAYPRLDDFRALATRLDPDGTFRNGYLDRLLDRSRPATDSLTPGRRSRARRRR